MHGAARDTCAHAASVAARELASAVDNRSSRSTAGSESNGNFHGAPVAYVLDFLAIVAADVASMSERRTDRFLDKSRNQGLTPFLAEGPGRGLGPDDRAVLPGRDRLRAQRLAALASVDSIPSSAMQEDHVSMGWAAARKAAAQRRRASAGCSRSRCSPPLRGIARQAPLLPGPATGAVVRLVESVAGWHRTGPLPEPPDRGRRRRGPDRCGPRGGRVGHRSLA